MQYVFLSLGTVRSILCVIGLAVPLLAGSQLASAQGTPKAGSSKNSAVNKEIRRLEERLGQLEERFVNMQSRLGTIESLAGRKRSVSSAPESGGMAGVQDSGYRGGGSATGENKNDTVGSYTRPARQGGNESQVETSGIPAPIPKEDRPAPRRIEPDNDFSPFGE